MSRFAGAFNNAMHQSNGCFPKAAAILAEALEFDDALRVEAALVLLGSMMQPGLGELERVFELDTGKTLNEFVSGFRPAAQKITDEMRDGVDSWKEGRV